MKDEIKRLFDLGYTVVTLPEKLDYLSIGKVVQELSAHPNKNRRHNLVLDFAALKEVDLIAMTLLFGQVWWYLLDGHTVRMVNVRKEEDPLRDVVTLLDDAGFFVYPQSERLFKDRPPAPDISPLKALTTDQMYMWVEIRLISWLSRKLKTPRDDFADLLATVGELLHNVRDHSGFPLAGVYADYNPSSGLIRICVADAGVGLITKIQEDHPNFSDEDCVRQAFQEGFSTHSTHKNIGMGLFTLVRTVCNNGGNLRVRTGTLTADITPDEATQPNIVFTHDCPYLKGTAYEIQLKVENMDLSETKDEDLLWD